MVHRAPYRFLTQNGRRHTTLEAAIKITPSAMPKMMPTATRHAGAISDVAEDVIVVTVPPLAPKGRVEFRGELRTRGKPPQ